MVRHHVARVKRMAPLVALAAYAMVALPTSGADTRSRAPVLVGAATEYGEAGGELLDARWRWRIGDDPAYAAPDYDDSNWSETLSWNPPRREGGPTIGWLRLRFQVPEALQGRVLTFLVTQCGASEIYVNGARVGSFGVVGEVEREEPAFADRLSRKVAVATMAAQADQVIAVRHSNASRHVLLHGELGSVTGVAVQAFAGGPDEGVTAFTALVHTLARHQTFQVATAATFAFLHLLLFVFYPQLRENLHFAAFAAAYALVVGLSIPAYGWPNSAGAALWVSRASRSGALLAGLAGCHFLYRIFGAQRTRWARVVLAASSVGV